MGISCSCRSNYLLLSCFTAECNVVSNAAVEEDNILRDPAQLSSPPSQSQCLWNTGNPFSSQFYRKTLNNKHPGESTIILTWRYITHYCTIIIVRSVSFIERRRVLYQRLDCVTNRDINVVQSQLSGAGTVEPLQQRENCRLPSSTGTHQCHALSCCHGNRQS